MKTKPAVLLHQVSKVYDGSPPLTALSGISLEIATGCFCLIQGPSGSGKTTLLGIIGGLERPSSGRVWISGVELTGSLFARERTAFLRDQVGFVFQDFKLINALTAEENISLSLQLRGVGRREARLESSSLLTRLGLGDMGRRRPQVLSGGEKQRVAIARALAGRPQLVLADEPTANLDGRTGQDVIGHLRLLTREQGTTVLVVSHDRRLAQQADRIIRIVDGMIENGGEKHEYAS